MEGLVNVPEVSQGEWEAPRFSPAARAGPWLPPSLLSSVTSGDGAWDDLDCPALVLMTFCCCHGTVTLASAVGDGIPTPSMPTFPWLKAPRSGPHFLTFSLSSLCGLYPKGGASPLLQQPPLSPRCILEHLCYPSLSGF